MVRIISGNEGGLYQYNFIISHQSQITTNILRADPQGLLGLHLHAIEQI